MLRSKGVLAMLTGYANHEAEHRALQKQQLDSRDLSESEPKAFGILPPDPPAGDLSEPNAASSTMNLPQSPGVALSTNPASQTATTQPRGPPEILPPEPPARDTSGNNVASPFTTTSTTASIASISTTFILPQSSSVALSTNPASQTAAIISPSESDSPKIESQKIALAPIAFAGTVIGSFAAGFLIASVIFLLYNWRKKVRLGRSDREGEQRSYLSEHPTPRYLQSFTASILDSGSERWWNRRASIDTNSGNAAEGAEASQPGTRSVRSSIPTLSNRLAPTGRGPRRTSQVGYGLP